MQPYFNQNYSNFIYPYAQQALQTLAAQRHSNAVNINYPNYQAAPMYQYQSNPINPALVKPKIAGDYTSLGTIKTPWGEDIYMYMLKSGQRVAIMPREGTTILKTFVDSGSMNENDRIRGISHFIEHNLFNGSSKLAPGQFFKEVVKMGATTNASTDYAQTDYYISSGIMGIEDFKKAVQMHADMILTPKFLEEMLTKEKGPVTSEISMMNDDVTTKAANEVVRKLFQINSNSENLVAGSIQTVNSLKRQDVVDYWKKHYTPDSMYTVIVGDVNPNDAIQQIAKEFNQPARVRSNDVTKEKLTPIEKSVRLDFKSETANSTNVLMGFASPPSNNMKDNIALEALDVLLEGNSNARLTKKLKGLNSYSSMSMQKVGLLKDDPQALFIAINTPANGEQAAIDAFYETIYNLAQNPPSEYEMQVIKSNLTKSLASSFESAESICETIGTGMLDGSVNEITNMQKIIDSLTPSDIVNAAQKYVDLNKVSMAVVHPAFVTDEMAVNNYKNGKYVKKDNVNSKAAAISFGSRNIDTSGVEDLHLHKNNAHVALNNSTKSDNCYIDWSLDSMSSMPQNLAVPYVLTELLNKGSGVRSAEQILQNTSAKAIDYVFDANGFKISANADCMSKNLGETIQTLQEILYNPNFSQKDFEESKNTVKQYFESMDKDGSNNMLVQLYPGYFGSPKEIIDGIEKMTINDVKKHYSDMLNNSSANIVVSAPFEKNKGLKEQTLSLLSNSPVVFKDFMPKFSNIYKPNQTEKVIVDSANLNQAQIYKTYSFKMPEGDMKSEVSFELLNEILGGSPASRLFQDLREKQQLAYRVSSDIQRFDDTGILTMYITSTTDDKEQNDIKYDNLQKSLDGFNVQVQKIMSEPVSEEELKSAKMQLKQAVAKQTELPATETGLLANNMMLPSGIRRIDEYVKTIDSITPEDINKAAQHIFSNKPTVSILASPDTINNQKTYISSLGEIIDKSGLMTGSSSN